MSANSNLFVTAPITNLLSFFHSFKNNPVAESAKLPGMFRYRTEVPHPWFSGVIVSWPPSIDESSIVQEQVDYFHKNEVAAFTWWLDPGISVGEWSAHLQQHGFQISTNTPGMACVLNDLSASVPFPANFSIQTVQDSTILET